MLQTVILLLNDHKYQHTGDLSDSYQGNESNMITEFLERGFACDGTM